MTRLALIRHGAYAQLADAPSALQPYPLTSEGAAQVSAEAQAFGDWLLDAGYQLRGAIHCSTLLRAWQTATIYRDTLAGLYVEPPALHSFSALCERSVGAVANLSVSEIERLVALDPRFDALPSGWKSASDFRLPFDGAESLLEAGERVARHLQALPALPDHQIQLVVGHGASIRHACYHLDVIAFSDIGRLSMFYGHPLVLERHADGWTRLYGSWKHRQTTDPVD